MRQHVLRGKAPWVTAGAVLIASIGALLAGRHVGGEVGLRMVAGSLFVVALAARVVGYLLDRRSDRVADEAAAGSEDPVDDLEPLSAIAMQWHDICTKAGIQPVPPIELCTGKHLGVVDDPGGPRLVAGEEFLRDAEELRGQQLAHEAAHLLAAHHLSAFDVAVIVKLAPSAGAYCFLALSAAALFTNIAALFFLGIAVIAIGIVAGLVAAAWSRDREYTADVLAAHLLGESLSAKQVAELVAAEPGGDVTGPFDSHPCWGDRYAAVHHHLQEVTVAARPCGRAVEIFWTTGHER